MIVITLALRDGVRRLASLLGASDRGALNAGAYIARRAIVLSKRGGCGFVFRALLRELVMMGTR